MSFKRREVWPCHKSTYLKETELRFVEFNFMPTPAHLMTGHPSRQEYLWVLEKHGFTDSTEKATITVRGPSKNTCVRISRKVG